MITYDDTHKAIVEKGIDSIRQILFSDDKAMIRSVLFCLDYYLDPYYKNRLSYENEIFELLQEVAVSSRDDEVIDDCLQLIKDYACINLTIMNEKSDNQKFHV
ncbi:MAG: hypothetical protein K2I10_05920 [Lachnospiraceae bacterium]|nr:hypothetical protein [Lachnospiraceae bacterium]